MLDRLPEILTETLVEIRTGNPETLGEIAMVTELQTRPDTVLYKDTLACCEDCPDVNDSPPDRSECPYFEYDAGKSWPVCTREGISDDQLNRFFFGQ